MTEQKHTPEPWHVGDHPSSSEDVLDSAGDLIARCRTDADAGRIVACVNACSGLDTTLLESSGDIATAAKEQAKHIASIEQQRDQLRAALEEIVDYPSLDAPELQRIARAALAATEGV